MTITYSRSRRLSLLKSSILKLFLTRKSAAAETKIITKITKKNKKTKKTKKEFISLALFICKHYRNGCNYFCCCCCVDNNNNNNNNNNKEEDVLLTNNNDEFF